MNKNGEIIYSRRAPKSSGHICCLNECDDELIYIKLTSRIVQECKFIDRLVCYSKENDVDLVIVREKYDIKAYISFDTTSHLNNLSGIISLADCNCFELDENDREITLILTFYTHQRCTKDGRCLYPFETDVPVDLNNIFF